jgi:hypothetical protein
LNSCLEYIESVLTDPDKAMPWDAWWQQHHEDAKASFTHREYLELKFKKAEAASRIFTKHTGFYIVLKLGDLPLGSTTLATRLVTRDRRRFAANLLSLVFFASNRWLSPNTGFVFGKKVTRRCKPMWGSSGKCAERTHRSISSWNTMT